MADPALIERRVRIFCELQAQERSRNENLGGQPISVTLEKDEKAVYPGTRLITTPLDIARQISKKKAADYVIAQVNGALWDMARPLEGDCKLALHDFKDEQGRDTFWHSSAHILGESLEQAYGCKLCIGPCTTRGEGFYYDAFYADGMTLNDENFPAIQSQVTKAVQEAQPFERIQVTREQALEIFSDNEFKVEIINDLPKDAVITVYRCGPLVDLCRGPHVPNTSYVKAFACLKASACYWKGKQDRESLQRVYGISYPDSQSLKAYMTKYEEAKKRDHRLLGKSQQLFFFHELSPGSAFFLPKGTVVYNKLLQFIRSEYRKRGFQEVVTPNIFNMKLWEESGHAAHYKENMFAFEIEKQEFGLKPMNCPGHCLLFQHRVRSYRELPLRIADFGVLHRNELSGALTGLTRVRRFSQDDAHIFCMESQVYDEVKGCLEFLDHVYTIFGFTYELKLSTRPEKCMGDSYLWDRAEGALEDALNAHGKPWEKNEGDGAFYGPKIDIQVSDALNRKFQCATIQLDFQLPIRFKLSYSAEDEAKVERPVMIHRAILGSVERMFAILLEDNAGKWPFWLSPRQAIVLTISEKFKDYAEEVRAKLHAAGFEVDVDISDRKIDKKVREAQMAHYNYLLVVGTVEQEKGEVNVRTRGSKAQRGSITIEKLIAEFQDLVANYTR